MTRLKSDAPLTRETAVQERGRNLIVDLHPGFCVIRQKGRRFSYCVDYQAIFQLGAKIAARVQGPKPHRGAR